MIKIKESDIIGKYKVCPYCGHAFRHSCCGEVHFEWAYEMKDKSVYFDHEVIIEKENENEHTQST